MRGVSTIISAIVMGMLTFVLFALFSSELAWVAAAFFVAAAFGIPLLAWALARGLGKRQLALRAELKAQIVDSIQGVQDLLACGRANDQQQKIAALDRELNQGQRRLALITGLQPALHETLRNRAL